MSFDTQTTKTLAVKGRKSEGKDKHSFIIDNAFDSEDLQQIHQIGI